MSEIASDPPRLRVISGGQAGADQAALDWAIARGIPHGGWCPKNRKTEDGKLDSKYQLVETPSSNYLERTEWNVRDSDATVIFTMTPVLTGGSKKTSEFAQALGKPWLHFRPGVHPKYLRTFLEKNKVATLNIAGSRLSGAPGIVEFVARCLDEAFPS